MNKIKVGVIFGGRSGEHEVSLVSAKSVMNALNKKKYNVVPIGITKQGKWIINAKPLNKLQNKAEISESESIIVPDPTKRGLLNIKKHFATPLKNHKKTSKLNIIFPILHGPLGEDGTIQGLFELVNLPYVGANVLASAIGMDKIIQKKLLKQSKIPVTDYLHFDKHEYNIKKDNIIKKINAFGYPIFVKPANMGSSVGITKVKMSNKLEPAILNALRFDRKVIIDKAVTEPREIEVAILGNNEPQASVCGEITASNEFYDYDAKYVDGKSQIHIPAKLSSEISKKIRGLAIKAFKAINCSGMARVDFLLDKNNTIYLNELNTIPGFTSISMYPKLWEASGLSFSKLLDKLIELGFERYQEKSDLSTTYQPKKDWYK